MAVILKFKMAADTMVIIMGTKHNMNLHIINYICANLHVFGKFVRWFHLTAVLRPKLIVKNIYDLHMNDFLEITCMHGWIITGEYRPCSLCTIK